MLPRIVQTVAFEISFLLRVTRVPSAVLLLETTVFVSSSSLGAVTDL